MVGTIRAVVVESKGDSLSTLGHQSFAREKGSGMSNSEPSFGELSRNTVERSKDVIFMVDAKMRITYCNPAWDEFALANGGEHVVPHESSELT